MKKLVPKWELAWETTQTADDRGPALGPYPRNLKQPVSTASTGRGTGRSPTSAVDPARMDQTGAEA